MAERFVPHLNRMVDSLVAKGSIMSPSVERAFRSVRRHRFLESWYRLEIPRSQPVRPRWVPVSYDRDQPVDSALQEVYSDTALVTRVDGFLARSSTSQPSLVADMLEILDVSPGMKVLEIGTGTGYNAALLSELVGPDGEVWSVELNPDVARDAARFLRDEGYRGVHVLEQDGFLGCAEGAPFDRIIATAACPDLSEHWLRQLAPGGQMLIPMLHGLADFLTQIERDEHHPDWGIGRIRGQRQFMSIEGTLACGNLWSSYAIPGWPLPAVSKRSLPDGLPEVEEGIHSLSDPVHLAFHFFLAAATREHWFANEGYGLADPGAESVLVVGRDSVIGHAPSREPTGADRLLERFSHLAERWRDLGRPGLESYRLSFMPYGSVDRVFESNGRNWVIRRTHFLEQIELPPGLP